MGYFDFFLQRPDFLPPSTIPYANKTISKKAFEFLFFFKLENVTMIISKMRVLGKQTIRGWWGGGANSPPKPV